MISIDDMPNGQRRIKVEPRLNPNASWTLAMYMIATLFGFGLTALLIWTSGADFRLDRSVLMECTDGMTNCAGPLQATAMYIDGADSHFNRNVVACTHVGFVNANGDNFYHVRAHPWPPSYPHSHPQQTIAQCTASRLSLRLLHGLTNAD
jgi:hypothetical protein